MKKITVSSPGKLMLLGEHAVVYNHPCLVTAVNQRMRLVVEKLSGKEFHLDAPDVKVVGYSKPLSDLGKGDIPKGAQFVEVAIKNILVITKKEITKGIKITSSSEFSSQFGFGSSSASTVCTIKALSELFNLNLSQKEMFDVAYKTVLDIQGKGSGFDVAAGIYGGTLYFFTGGKKIEPLPVKNLPLIVGYSGIKADTVTLMNQVKEKFKDKPEKLEKIYMEIGKLVDKAKEAIASKNWKEVGAYMNKNQIYLKELGVSIQKLDNMINAAVSAGAYGAKLSGAGGGDCMIALCSPENRQKIENAIKSVGGEIISINTNAEGIKISD